MQQKDHTLECRRCKHYYITWDNRFPHGCRAMGFKSGKMPCLAVYQSSGMACMMFREKPKRKK